MIFGPFSMEDIIEINQRTIERMRAQRSSSGGEIENDGKAAARARGCGRTGVQVRNSSMEELLNSDLVKFSRSEIQNAFAAASRKLRSA